MYPHNCPLCCVNVVQTTYVVERLSACTDTIPSPPSHSLKGWRHAKQCQEDDDVIYRSHTSVHVYKLSFSTCIQKIKFQYMYTNSVYLGSRQVFGAGG